MIQLYRVKITMKPETMGVGSGAALAAAESGASVGAFALVFILFFMYLASQNASK
jgi:hypothetical protein